MSDWVAAERSVMRLFLSERSDGVVLGGVELRLDPGWYTYWRHPGDAGVPPVFDFSASENVGGVEVLYPTPERYDDGVTVSLVYREAVVFPIAVTPRDAAAPVTLRLDLDFGVCREVCVPTKATAELAQPPSFTADPTGGFLRDSAMRRVPEPPQPGRFAVEHAGWDGDDLVVEVRMPDADDADLFADLPPAWFAGQPVFVTRMGGVSTYRMAVYGRWDAPADAPGTIGFVGVAGAESIEQQVAIPARPAAR